MRKLKSIPCLRCGNVGVYCKGMCQSCYEKNMRGTPEGKLQLKKYNDTKGKDACKRYRLKLHPNPITKNYAVECECGKPSVIKGLCKNCYHRNYNRERLHTKPAYYRKRKTNIVDTKGLFKLISNDVMQGMTISQSCKKQKISRSTMYRNISDKQVKELKELKMAYAHVLGYGLFANMLED